jgi:thiamine biosynthesis protein ThiS
MKIILNDRELDVATGISISELLNDLGIQDYTGFAIAINGEVISSCQWQITLLKHTDRILMIEAIQGG